MPRIKPQEELPTIARRRMALGINQRVFAHMLGVAASYYPLLERGANPITPRVAARIEIVLAELERAEERARLQAAKIA